MYCRSCNIELNADNTHNRDARVRNNKICDSCYSIMQKRYTRKKKIDTLRAYGAVCNYCGESNLDLLQIDHTDGNQGSIRKFGSSKESNLTHGAGLYAKLKREHYPDGYQVLCISCNSLKAHLSHGVFISHIRKIVYHLDEVNNVSI